MKVYAVSVCKQIEELIAEQINSLEQRDRLVRIRPDRDSFVAELQQSRMNVHAVSTVSVL